MTPATTAKTGKATTTMTMMASTGHDENRTTTNDDMYDKRDDADTNDHGND